MKDARSIMFGAALISVILSLWAITRDDLINNDGILYISTAKLFLDG